MGPRRIGVLTGGGDCPGLNAVIRAVVKTATLGHGVETVGILDGYQGLVEDRVVPLDRDSVSGILDQGAPFSVPTTGPLPRRYPDGTDADGKPRIVDATDRCLATAEKHGTRRIGRDRRRRHHELLGSHRPSRIPVDWGSENHRQRSRGHRSHLWLHHCRQHRH